MKKVIIFAIVTMTAVLMLTAASFGQRRTGSYGGDQGRRIGQSERREYPGANRGGFQREYSPRIGQIKRQIEELDFRLDSLMRQREHATWRLNNSRNGFEARRELYRIESEIRETRERKFSYARMLREAGGY